MAGEGKKAVQAFAPRFGVMALVIALVLSCCFSCKSSIAAKVNKQSSAAAGQTASVSVAPGTSDAGGTDSIRLGLTWDTKTQSMLVALASNDSCTDLLVQKSLAGREESVEFTDLGAGQYFICAWATLRSGEIVKLQTSNSPLVLKGKPAGIDVAPATADPSVDPTMFCEDLKGFPGYELEPQLNCVIRIGDATVTSLAGNWTLSLCSSLIINPQNGLVSGRVPLRSCNVGIEAVLDGVKLNASFSVLPRTTLHAIGRDFNSPTLDHSFGIKKIGADYWSYGSGSINVFDADLNFKQRFSKKINALPSERVDSLTPGGGYIFSGTSFGLARSADQGTSWQRMDVADSSGSPLWFSRLAQTSQKLIGWSGQAIYVMGFDGSLAFTLTPGAAPLPSGTIKNLTAIDDVIYISSTAGVHYSADHGATWATWSTPNLAHLQVNEVSAAAGVFYVSTQGGVSRFDGTSWTSFLPAALPGGYLVNTIGKTRVDGARVVIASTTYPVFGQPRLGISTDSGATWTHLDNFPTGCPSPGGAYEIILEGQRIILGANTGILYSNDFGSTWQCLSNGGNRGGVINSNVIRDGDSLFSTSWGSGLWKGSLATGQWTNYRQPRVPGRSDLSLGHIFGPSLTKSGNEMFMHRWQSSGFEYSSDGGATFTSIDTTATGMTYFIEMQYRGNVLYGAGHGVGFGMSTDKGLSWTRFTTAQGLPSDIVRRMTFGLNGRIFVATDAGLAFTDDQGAHWETRHVASGMSGEAVGNVIVDGTRVLTYAPGAPNISLSNDSGTTFNVIDLSNRGLAGNVVYSASMRGGVIFLGLAQGAFALSADGGMTWEYMSEVESKMVAVIKDILPFDDRFFLNTDAGLMEFK